MNITLTRFTGKCDLNSEGVPKRYYIFRNTCRCLFEHHKLMFSFHMCVKILDNLGKIVKAEYNFLLRGGVVLDKENQMDNPCAAWLSDDAWDNITELDKIAGFHGIIDTFEQYPKDWNAWYTHTEPETLPLIGSNCRIYLNH
jgi:dynein heavy chain